MGPRFPMKLVLIDIPFSGMSAFPRATIRKQGSQARGLQVSPALVNFPALTDPVRHRKCPLCALPCLRTRVSHFLLRFSPTPSRMPLLNCFASLVRRNGVSFPRRFLVSGPTRSVATYLLQLFELFFPGLCSQHPWAFEDAVFSSAFPLSLFPCKPTCPLIGWAGSVFSFYPHSPLSLGIRHISGPLCQVRSTSKGAFPSGSCLVYLFISASLNLFDFF